MTVFSYKKPICAAWGKTSLIRTVREFKKFLICWLVSKVYILNQQLFPTKILHQGFNRRISFLSRLLEPTVTRISWSGWLSSSGLGPSPSSEAREVSASPSSTAASTSTKRRTPASSSPGSCPEVRRTKAGRAWVRFQLWAKFLPVAALWCQHIHKNKAAACK